MKKVTVEKVLKIVDSVVTFICTFCFVSILLISGYFIYDSVNVRNDSRSSNVSDYRPTLNAASGTWDLNDIMSLNSDIIGWVTVDDTTIDLPLLQNTEQRNYLNYDYRGRPSVSGSLYLADNETINDNLVVIYGHHIDGGAMLGCLDSFTDASYLAAHRTGRIMVPDATHEFNIIACGRVDAYSSIYDGDLDGLNDIELYTGSFDSVSGQRVFIFSTCTSDNGLERLVVVAVENT